MASAGDESTSAPEQQASPGGILQAERRKQGLSVPDVARSLKLAPRQVEALEADNYAALPGPMFVRGFIRNYARVLGLDADALVTDADTRLRQGGAAQGVPRPSVNIPVPAMDSEARRLAAKNGRTGSPFVVAAVVGAVVIGLVVAYVAWAPRETLPPSPVAGETGSSSQEVELKVQAESAGEAAGGEAAPPSASPATAPEAVPAQPAAPVPERAAVPAQPPAPGAERAAVPTQPPAPVVPAGTATQAPAGGEGDAQSGASGEPGTDTREIRLSFGMESWVEVRDRRGKVIFSQINPEGTEQVVRGRPPFSLVVGNAKGVTLTYEGKVVDLAPHMAVSVARLTLE
jgi:cytoskeleton protein RodZ